MVKFMHRSRLTTFAALASLNGRQQYMADKMSTLLIRESTDFDDSTEDDFELEQENVLDITEHGKRIFKSKDIID